ncbi:MAG TPA: YdcF family protein [Syntrophorhabdaceae bacterium]|jgi:uncharacterized SAM-binding protein YcdF (DUF218 family)
MIVAFVLKKLITCCLIPPGLFVVAALIVAFFARKKARIAAFALAAAIYLTSIGPVGDLLLGNLEKAYEIPALVKIAQCDVYVVLGGGANPRAPTIDGKGLPSPEALTRVMAAYRLYLIDRKPIILSGGDYLGRETEAEITKRYLINLGVDKELIITETRARNTYENAYYTRVICEERGFRRILLVTSAFHMRRSVMLFNKLSGPVTPFPAGSRASGAADPFSWLPDIDNTVNVTAAVREYIGILFYKITL